MTTTAGRDPTPLRRAHDGDADQPRAARPARRRPPGVAAWAAAMAVLREVDRVFSTYRADSFVSRLGRGEIGLADCPPEVAEVLALGALAEERSHGAFVVLPGPDGAPVLDPSGVVKGWAVERAAEHLRRLADTDFCLSAGGDMVCRTLDPGDDAVADRHRGPARPARVLAVVPVRTGAVATSGTRPPRRARRRRADRPAADAGRLGHRRRRRPDLGRHRRHGRLRAWGRTPRAGSTSSGTARGWSCGATARSPGSPDRSAVALRSRAARRGVSKPPVRRGGFETLAALAPQPPGVAALAPRPPTVAG